MENPKDWTLIDGSLAAWNLEQDPRGAWAFLVLQGLVRDSDRNQAAFLRLVREELDRGPITGPSVAKRVGGGLSRLGISRDGIPPDPGGDTAAARLKTLQGWRRT